MEALRLLYEKPLTEVCGWEAEGVICESGYIDDLTPIEPWGDWV